MNRAGSWLSRWADASPSATAPHLALLALGLGAAALGETLARTADSNVTVGYTVLVCVLALLTTGPLALLPPAAAAVIVTAASVLSRTPLHALTVAGAAAQLVGLFRLTRTGSQLLAGCLAVPFLVIVLAAPSHGEAKVLGLLLAALAPAAAWAGAARTARDQRQAHAAARHVIDGTLLDHSARGERARIARELHDVVAHHISMIAVQAETARLTTAGLPATGAQRLTVIGDTARAALTEMRRLLGVLREDTDDVAVRTPQPGLRQLNELLDDARDASGVGTRLILRGPPDALDPGVELAAYRIVQEALTNARRHAPGAAVDVELHYTDDTLQLSVRDNGPGPPPAGSIVGHGLLGMRERAAAVGGTLRTGPAPGGGFLVDATLPAKTELT